MSSTLEIRNHLRRQLTLLRDQIEANIDICLTNPSVARHQERAVQLQADHMETLLAFADVGGIVLAVPLYKRDCRNGTIRARKNKIHRLLHYKRYFPSNRIPTWLRSEQVVPDTGIFFTVHTVMRKNGAIKRLERLQGPIGEPGEDERVWKWMFCDLREDEVAGGGVGVGEVVVRERSRWGWAGKFGLGMDMAGGWAWDRMDTREDPERIFELV